MDVTIWSAVISAASGIIGAGVGGAISGHAQRKEREDRARDQFARLLAATNTALDLLMIEIQALPRPTAVAAVTNRVVSPKRLPNVTALLSWLGSITVFRSAHQAVQRFNQTAHELSVFADLEVLQAMETISSLLAEGEDPLSKDWQERWQEARKQLVFAGRRQIGRPDGVEPAGERVSQ